MEKRSRGNKAGTIVLYLVLVLALVGGVGAIAYFTDGFRGDFKTFYVNIDGKDVLTDARGYRISVSDPLTVNVKTLGSGSEDDYTVRIVPNADGEHDFDFTVDGQSYSYGAVEELTRGFVITQSSAAFIIRPKGGITKILSEAYPDSEVGDCADYGYEDMFAMSVTAKDGKGSVTIYFTVMEQIKEVTLDRDTIVF